MHDKPSLIQAFSGHVTHKFFWGFNRIIGTAKSKVVKFCTRVSYINSINRMTYHQQKGRGYGHVIVLNFCRLS